MALIAARFTHKTSSLLPLISSAQPQLQITQNLIQSRAGHNRTYYTYVNEPSHPIPGKKPKTVTAEEAVSVVKSGTKTKHFAVVVDNHK